MSDCCSPNGPALPGPGSPAFIVPTLAALATLTAPNGASAFVLDQNEPYRLDTSNSFATFSPLIISATGGGRWFRRSKAYVVANSVLWVTGAQDTAHNKVFGLTPGQLLVSNPAIVPDIVLDFSALLPAGGLTSELCTDAQGNLWLATLNSGATPGVNYKFALGDCLKSGSPAPAVALTGLSGVTDAQASVVCFDKQNNLWVGGNQRFRQIGQYQAALTGAPTPLVVLGNAATFSAGNRYLIFDAVGNLWFTNSFGGTAQISRITPAQYAASNAAIVPSVVWSGANVGPVQDLAFDSNGLLWAVEYVTGLGNGRIKAFDPTQPTGNPAPVINITSASLSGGVGLCFDSAGNLWIGNNDNGTLLKFDKASLGSSGAKVPSVALKQTVVDFLACNRFSLDPQRVGVAPSGVPLTL